MTSTIAEIREAFRRSFPKQTAGKSREEVKEIMKDMGYGIKSGLMKEFRKKKGLATGGVVKMQGGGKVQKLEGGGPILSKILGEGAKNISDADRKLVNDILGESGKTISDADRARINRIMGSRKMQGGGEALRGGGKGLGTKTIDINTPSGRRKISQIRKIMPDASRDEIIKFGINAGVLKKAKGGEVPVKMQGGGLTGGQKKLDKNKDGKISGEDFKLMKDGGPVKMGSGGGICRGMGAARAGGKFKIR